MKENIIYFVVSVLDPRVKGLFILNQANSRETLTKVQYYIKETYRSNQPICPEVPQIEYNLLQLRVLRAIHKEAIPASVVDQHFDSQVVTWNSKDDNPNWVLNWKRVHAGAYPIMGQVARDFLAIRGTEVSVERLFSQGRDLISIRRHSLSPATMRATVLLKSHLMHVE